MFNMKSNYDGPAKFYIDSTEKRRDMILSTLNKIEKAVKINIDGFYDHLLGTRPIARFTANYQRPYDRDPEFGVHLSVSVYSDLIRICIESDITKDTWSKQVDFTRYTNITDIQSYIRDIIWEIFSIRIDQFGMNLNIKDVKLHGYVYDSISHENLSVSYTIPEILNIICMNLEEVTKDA